MKIELKENSKQMDIKGIINNILSNSKTFLLDYPYKNVKEALWERQGRELTVMLSLCSNEYISSCCEYDVYTSNISRTPEDNGLLEFLRSGGKLGNRLMAKYDSFSVCYKCKKWCGLLEDDFFTYPHESDII